MPVSLHTLEFSLINKIGSTATEGRNARNKVLHSSQRTRTFLFDTSLNWTIFARDYSHVHHVRDLKFLELTSKYQKLTPQIYKQTVNLLILFQRFVTCAEL